MQSRILITEVGTMNSLGMGFEQLSAGLESTPVNSSVKDYEFHHFDTDMPCRLVKGFDPVEVLGKKGLRTKDNATKMLLGTLEYGPLRAIMESSSDQDRPGLCIGTAFGSVQSIGDFLSDSIVNGVSNVNPQAFANTVINSPTGNANIRYVARNLSATVSSGFNAGIDAVIYACDHLRSGYLQSIVAGGLEEVSYYSLLGMQRTGILSPSGQSRPFATDSDGCLVGEGCALFLLELEERAIARGTQPMAEIAGYASAFDPTAAQGKGSDPEPAMYVIKEACAQAGISPRDLSFVASGANGIPRWDKGESEAIMNLTNGTVPVATYKTFTGECYGASGTVIMMCALADMKKGRISGAGQRYATVKDLPVVFDTIQRTSGHVLVSSFSCEGNCSAVVLKNLN